MSKTCFSFVFFCLSVVVLVASDGPQKLPLTVYYESKCPDSEDFILYQLSPAMKMLHKYVNLKMVPFGKASSTNQGLNDFKCQHGEMECLGNIIQDCALFFMEGRDDIDKVEYVSCEMKTFASTQGNSQCIEKSKVPLDLINQCVSSEQGIMLQLESEILTNMVKPSFIPTVMIANEFNQQIQDIAQKDLVGVLCSILKEAQPCAELYNNQALEYVLL